MLLPLFMMLLFGGTLHSTPVIPLHHKRIYLVNTLFHFLNNSVNQIITAQGPLKDPTNLLWKTALQTPIHLIAAGVKTATGNTAGRNAALEQIKELRTEIKEQDKVGHALFFDSGTIVRWQKNRRFYSGTPQTRINDARIYPLDSQHGNYFHGTKYTYQLRTRKKHRERGAAPCRLEVEI